MQFSQFVFGAVLAFGAGIFFISFFSLSFFILPLFLFGIMLVAVFWERWKIVCLGIFFMLFAFGGAYYIASSQLPEPLSLPIEISFIGRVIKSPEKSEQGTRLVLEAPNISGRILLFTSLFQKIKQGDSVLVTGKIQSPVAFENFNYPLYLAKNGVYWVMFYPQVEFYESGTPFLFNIKERMQEQIDRFFVVPQSSLISSMLLGNKASLSDEFALKLNATGTRHITAVSGMHVAILSGMLFSFLLNIGIPKKKSSLLVILFLIFFVIFTGVQTSAVRAGIMGSAFLIAGLTGRINLGLRTLVFAAIFLLLFNPLLMAHDIGFQLSFLAVLGILLFLPLFQYFFRAIPNHFGIRDIIGMSITAQLFTLPLVLHYFGILSFVSLVTNLCIVPLLPIILLLGVFFLLGSFIIPFLATPLAFILGLFLLYISFVIESIAELPFAAIQVEEFPIWILLPFLFVASFFALRFQRQRKFQFLGETMLL